MFEDLLKEHVNQMEQTDLLKELTDPIKENKLLSNHGNVARTSGSRSLMAARTTRPELMMR
jgi:hypothetical protein